MRASARKNLFRSHMRDSLKRRFPILLDAYRRAVAPRLGRHRSHFALSRWVEDGLSLSRDLQIEAITLDRDGAWISDKGGTWWSYTPRVFLSAMGAELGRRYEPAEIDQVLALLEPGQAFIDVGANVGAYSMAVAKRHADVEVHAFEPVSTTREVLERNVARNALADRITVHPDALSDREGSALITTSQNVCNHLVPADGSAAASHAERVPLRRLDNVLAGIRRPVGVIKCDVEGSEFQVLRGATQTLERHRPHLLIELDPRWSARYGHRPSEVVEFLSSKGYICREAVSERPCIAQSLDEMVSGQNLLFKAPPRLA